jgi:hypothetical protein
MDPLALVGNLVGAMLGGGGQAAMLGPAAAAQMMGMGQMQMGHQVSSGQCCGSETIFFLSGFGSHFRPEFWIRIRILFD